MTKSAMDDKADILEVLDLEVSLKTKDDREQLMRIYRSELTSGSAGKDIDRLHEVVKSSVSIMKGRWPDLIRRQCRQLLAKDFSEQSRTRLDEAIDIALRIWLIVDSRDDSVTGYPRRWNEQERIEDVVRSRFPHFSPLESQGVTRFPRRFRAVDLERISGIVIQWTTFLDEHLRFNDDNRTLKVFNNKAWLLAVMNQTSSEKPAADPKVSKSTQTLSSEVGLPKAMLEETIKTLDVLFPPWHDRTVKFLLDQNQDFHLQPPVPRDLPRLREFTYWRERLVDVVVEFESPPRNWKHIWRDRRYPVAFWTFWLGFSIFLFTIVFGFIGALLGGLALRAAVEQVKLSSTP